MILALLGVVLPAPAQDADATNAPAPSGYADQPTPPSSPTTAPAPTTLSPVIWTENPDVVERFAVDPQAVREMLDRALLKLTSAPDIATAWRRLGITPQDVVGIKITTMGGPLLSTHRPLVQAVCDGLQAAGVPPEHIIIWDKQGDDMVRGGYPPSPGSPDHVGVEAVFPGAGYDPDVTYHNGIIGTLIWGDRDFLSNAGNADLYSAARAAVAADPLSSGGSGGMGDTSVDGISSMPQTSANSYYTNLVTRVCTKIINMPVLTDNAFVGINGCLASLALASVDNNRRFQGDPSYGDPAICEILDRDFMRRKTVIHILDALVAEYAGGPRANPLFTHSIGALYVSRDPVAIDSRVLPRLEVWRRAAHVDPIGKTGAHVHDAAFYNLGTDDPTRIQLIRV